MNNPEEIMAALRGMRFLHDIEDQYLQALTPIAELREFPAGTVLFREGQSHPNIYLIIAGSVALISASPAAYSRPSARASCWAGRRSWVRSR